MPKSNAEKQQAFRDRKKLRKEQLINELRNTDLENVGLNMWLVNVIRKVEDL